MNVFPVISAVLSPEHLSSWAAAQYGLHGVTCRILKTNMNDSYLVTADEGRFVLRVYSHKYRNLREVSEEVEILLRLKEKDIDVAYPIRTEHGTFVQEIHAPEGLRNVVLFSFAEGGKIRFLSPEMCRAIGVAMGRFHAAAAGVETSRTRYSAAVLAGWAHTQVAGHFPQCVADLEFMRDCEAALDKAFCDPVPRTGIVHLDIWYDNMSVQEDGKITLFDFDNLGSGPLILDPGYFCMQLFQIEPDKTVYEQKKWQFIEGYRSVMSVSDAELALIPMAGMAVWIHYLGVQAERFDTFGNRFLSANYIAMFLGRARDWLAYNGAALG